MHGGYAFFQPNDEELSKKMLIIDKRQEKTV